MLSNRPYLLRAFYEWIIDSNCTPILVADANDPGCKAPLEYAEEGEFAFSLSARAVRDLKISSTSVDFKASFAGIIYMVSLPLPAIISLYADENGEGIYFDEEDEIDGSNSVDTRNGLVEQTDMGLSLVDVNKNDGVNDPVSEPTVSIPNEKAKPFLKLVE